jgi:hypothetical protein
LKAQKPACSWGRKMSHLNPFFLKFGDQQPFYVVGVGGLLNIILGYLANREHRLKIHP